MMSIRLVQDVSGVLDKWTRTERQGLPSPISQNHHSAARCISWGKCWYHANILCNEETATQVHNNRRSHRCEICSLAKISCLVSTGVEEAQFLGSSVVSILNYQCPLTVFQQSSSGRVQFTLYSSLFVSIYWESIALLWGLLHCLWEKKNLSFGQSSCSWTVQIPLYRFQLLSVCLHAHFYHVGAFYAVVKSCHVRKSNYLDFQLLVWSRIHVGAL